MGTWLSNEKRLAVLAALVDGNSVRATCRMTDVNLRTVLRFGVMLGEGAQRLHNALARDLRCHIIENDEIWGYVGKKQARVTPKDGPDVGEAYVFVSLDKLSRFAITWKVGKRDQSTADAFVADLRSRLVVMPALTSDGFAPYISAIGTSFGPGVDYAQTIKNYRQGAQRGPDHRYEPPRGIDFITKRAVFGAPDLDRATTAHIERQNGTMRCFIGRMRRLVYAFSKKLENHRAAVALCYAYYNYCWVVKTLRVTPAMAIGLTDHIWELQEFMDAVLAAAPCEMPERKPLAHRVPEGTARELLNGRGFLRVVQGGAAPTAPKPPESPGPVPMVGAPHVASVPTPSNEGTGQIDLFSWKPRPAPPPPTKRLDPGQLSLFGVDLDPPDDDGE